MILKVLIRNSVKQNKYGLLATRYAGHKDQTHPHRSYYGRLPSSCLNSPEGGELPTLKRSQQQGVKHPGA